MKKIVLLLSATTVMFGTISCKKTAEIEDKGIVKSDEPILVDNGKVDSTINYITDINGKKSIKTDYVYKATDGSLVKVVFDYNENTMSVKSNNKTFILKKIESKGNETIYEKMDMKATVKADSLILDQGNNLILLVKTKI